MTKLLYLAIIAATLAILACSEQATPHTGQPAPTLAPITTATTAPQTTAPTPSQTAETATATIPATAPEPTSMPGSTEEAPSTTEPPPPPPTQEPISTVEPPEPLPTREPTVPPETITPTQETGQGIIAPLLLENPETAAAELTAQELDCVSKTLPPDQIHQMLRHPELADPEQRQQVIGCLTDETLMRLFLTGFIGETGPLSAETSDCVRTGFEHIDLRYLMTAEAQGDEQGAMAGAMAAFTTTLACLNQEEWLAIAPIMGMDPSNRDSVLCLVEKMGGPEEMSRALNSEDESGLMKFFAASMECGLRMDEEPPTGDN